MPARAPSRYRVVRLVLAAAVTGTAWLALSIPEALGACGGGASGDSFAESVAPHVEAIVVARVVSEPAPSNVPREPAVVDVVDLAVLRVVKGRAPELITVDAGLLGDCTEPSTLGERIVLAWVGAAHSGERFIGSWHEDSRGRWWHHFDTHGSLRQLLQDLGALPDTAVRLERNASGPKPSPGLAWVVAIGAMLSAVLALEQRRRRSSS